MVTNSASTSHTGLRVLIAGGGIAGLSLARALKNTDTIPWSSKATLGGR
jgi:uncharacterized protein with NAD-binding domain and iron-sulfur cluster